MKKHIFTLASLLTLGTLSAQVRTVNSATNVSVTNSPAFIDASSNTTVNGSANVGKGLIFPRVDLSAMTAFPGVTAGIANSFPTRFDGMIVYNTASSGTAGVGSTQGTLSPGYWYYENKSSSNTGGTWKPVSTATAAVANTASNGLTLAGNDVKLGGTLAQPTTINSSNTNPLNLAGAAVRLLNGGGLNSTSGNEQLAMGYSGTSTYMHAVRTRHNAGAAAGNAIDFYTWKFGTDAIGDPGTQQVMTLDGTGNVGIGKATPSAPLDVAGNVNISPKGGTASSLNLYEDTANGTNKITVKSPANVATDRTITLPANTPVNGYALVTDASGNTSWGSVTPSASTLSSIALLTSSPPIIPVSPNNGAVPGSQTDQRFFQQFDTAIVNPLNNFNTATGTFTAPQAGNYLVTAYIVPNAAPYNNTPNFYYPVNLEVRKNCGGVVNGGSIVMDNATIRWATPIQASNGTGVVLRYAVNVNGMVTLAAGDTLNLVVYLSGPNAAATDTAGGSFPQNFTYATATTFKALFSVTAL